MSQMNQFNQMDPVEQQPGSVWPKIAIGCGAVLIIALCLITAGGYWVWNNAKSLVSGVAAEGMIQMVETSDLTDDQKSRIVLRVEQVRDDFVAGVITLEQVTEIGERISESPAIYIASVMFVEQVYIVPSGLSDDEKEAANRTLQRYARGLYNGDYPIETLDDVLAPIQKTDASGQQQFKENPTDEDLRDLLDLAKEKADSAGVPDESFEVDVAGEIENAIDEVLQGPVP
jgi:hypothetical protein